MSGFGSEGECPGGVYGTPPIAYAVAMRPTIKNDEALRADGSPPERGHDAWVRAKVEEGLRQSADRSTMLSTEQLWRDLRLEP